MSNAEEKMHISNVSLLTMRYMKFFFYSAKHYNEPPGEVALRIDHMVGIAIHHNAVRRGGHCELTTWWALRSTTKPLGEVALRIMIILEEHPRET